MEKRIEKENIYLVAVSGGPDSMALLDILFHQGKNLVVVHANYKTRHASDYETQLIALYCDEHNLAFHYKIIDYYQSGNFQNFARIERYSFFKTIYDQYHGKGLYVAHHLDDSLETYVMQKRRHNIVGYYGIASHSTMFDMEILRPLLGYHKADLLHYCQENNVPYSIDITNNSPKYTRNKIRLLELSQMNQEQKEELICQMAKANEENNVQQQNIVSLYQKLVTNYGILLKQFHKLNNKEQLMILHYYLKNKIGNLIYEISIKKLQDYLNQINSHKPNIYLPLFHKFVLAKEYNYLYLLYEQEEEDYCFEITSESQMVETKWFIVQHSGQEKEQVIASADDYPLYVRNYRQGDRVQTKNGYKRVNRLFIDRKVPLKERAIYPLVTNKDGLIILIPQIYQNYLHINLKSKQFVIKLSDVNKI